MSVLNEIYYTRAWLYVGMVFLLLNIILVETEQDKHIKREGKVVDLKMKIKSRKQVVKD